jgi:hypothetical protein
MRITIMASLGTSNDMTAAVSSGGLTTNNNLVAIDNIIIKMTSNLTSNLAEFGQEPEADLEDQVIN